VDLQDKKETIFDRPPVRLESSPTEFEQGIESQFWQDMKRQIEAWLSDVRDTLEDSDNFLFDKTLHRLGGNAEALRRVLILPGETLKNLRENRKEV
jgi:hypothetical protein